MLKDLFSLYSDLAVYALPDVGSSCSMEWEEDDCMVQLFQIQGLDDVEKCKGALLADTLRPAE